jgi:hypothetical protein
MADGAPPVGSGDPPEFAQLVRPGSTWAFDVDGTLIGSIRSDVTRPGAASLLEALVRRGVVCVLWSAGGDDYAQRMAERHGLALHVSAYYAKDVRDADGTYLVDHFSPAHVPDVLVDDSPVDLRAGRSRWVIGVRQFMGGHPADRELVELRERVEQYEQSG